MNAKNKVIKATKVKWSTSKASVASVSKKGVVTGKKIGSATIKAKYSGKTYSFKIKVVKASSLNKTSISIEIKETYQLSVDSDYASVVSWRSDNANVASVDSYGSVVAIKAGTTRVYAKLSDGKELSCLVEVKEPVLIADTSSITLNLKESKTVTITSNVTKNMDVEISDTDVVSCKWGSWSGRNIPLTITSKSPGSTIITVKNKDSGMSININVTVESDFKINLPSTPISLKEYDYRNNIEQIYTVDKIRLETKYSSYSDEYKVYLYFSGSKQYDVDGIGHSTSAKIGWKLYDKTGAVVDSGTCYTSAVCVGERFADAKDYIYDLKEGTYTLVLLNSGV